MELSPEDLEEGMRGKAMYGTRDASQNWGMEHADTMTEAKFKQGVCSARVLYYEERNISALAHGEDFAVFKERRPRLAQEGV